MFGYFVVRSWSASPTVPPDTWTESLCSVNWRSAVGIKILAILIPLLRHWSDRDLARNCWHDRISRSERRGPQTNTKGRSSSDLFQRNRRRRPDVSGRYRSSLSLAHEHFAPLRASLRVAPGSGLLVPRSRRFRGRLLLSQPSCRH